MKGSSIMQGCLLPQILRTMTITMHHNYKRQHKKKRSEKAENVSVSWDPTTVDCKFIKNEISRLEREKMAKEVSPQYIFARRGPLICTVGSVKTTLLR